MDKETKGKKNHNTSNFGKSAKLFVKIDVVYRKEKRLTIEYL